MGLSPGQVEIVSTLLAGFLMEQRGRYYRSARPIELDTQLGLQGFFRKDLLELVRTLQLDSGSMANPDFYPQLEKMGMKDLPDFSEIEAITFGDVIVFSQPMTTGLLFHELVHTEQYRQLGIAGFAKRYVGGFLQSGAYEAIPLEIQAYGLGAEFEANPHRPFSVEQEVHRWMLEGRF